MAVEEDVAGLVGAEPAAAARSLGESLEGIQQALVLIAREVDSLREAVLAADAKDLTPAQRAALLYKVEKILAEMGDGSE